MPVFALDEHLRFPPPQLASPSGLLAVGGDLSPARLLLAYRNGIFPWYDEGMPILWHCPDPRMVLKTEDVHLPKSLRKTIRREPFTLTLDTAFSEVVRGCAEASRPDQEGTWITDDMSRAYCTLHELGYAHSVEAWEGEMLVGGLYGVSLGGVYFGESMFTRAPDASKVAFAFLVEVLRSRGIHLIDCQVYTEHLARFGAKEVSRDAFLTSLNDALERPTLPGPWTAL